MNCGDGGIGGMGDIDFVAHFTPPVAQLFLTPLISILLILFLRKHVAPCSSMSLSFPPGFVGCSPINEPCVFSQELCLPHQSCSRLYLCTVAQLHSPAMAISTSVPQPEASCDSALIPTLRSAIVLQRSSRNFRKCCTQLPMWVCYRKETAYPLLWEACVGWCNWLQSRS